MTRTLTLVILILVLGYGSLKAWPLLRGPLLELDSPLEGASAQAMTVAGTALHTRTLFLDGSPLLIDESGRFSQTLTLPPGGAILSLTATDRFGRSETLTRTVFVP